MRLRVYDVSNVADSGSDGSIAIAKPADVAAQPWGYRSKGASEQQGEMLITENVTLGPSQRVGEQARHAQYHPDHGRYRQRPHHRQGAHGRRRLSDPSPPATIDAHYLWQTDDGETIIVRNGGSFGALVPTFETRATRPMRTSTRARI